MKKLVVFASLIASLNLHAQTAPEPTIQAGVQQIWDAAKAGVANWYVIPYALYAPGLTKRAGGGLAAMFPMSQYVVGGLRVDYVNGNFWMPSGSATFQVPVKLNSWLTVTPLAFAGVGVPVSGGSIAGVLLPGRLPKDNNGQPTGIIGYGTAVHIYNGTGWLKSLDLVADRETWSGFNGAQYRLGLAGKF